MVEFYPNRQHCGKRRDCSSRAISPFPTVFSKDFYCRHIKTRAYLGKGYIACFTLSISLMTNDLPTAFTFLMLVEHNLSALVFVPLLFPKVLFGSIIETCDCVVSSLQLEIKMLFFLIIHCLVVYSNATAIRV